MQAEGPDNPQQTQAKIAFILKTAEQGETSGGRTVHDKPAGVKQSQTHNPVFVEAEVMH